MTAFDEAATPVPTTPAPTPPTPVRASDADRNDVVDRLQHALGEGRLDLAETEERVTAAYAARYRSDLPPLLADLPATQGTSRACAVRGPAVE